MDMEMETFDLGYFVGEMKKLEPKQAELARNIGVAAPTVSKWYSGEQKPSLDCLLMISKVYGVSIDKLVNPEYEESIGSSRRGLTAAEICEMILDIEKALGAKITGKYADNWNEIEKGEASTPVEKGELNLFFCAHYDENLCYEEQDYDFEREGKAIQIIKFFSTLNHLRNAPNIQVSLIEDMKKAMLKDME